MSNNSKSMALPFIIISVLIFAGAFGYKYFNKSESQVEVIVKEPVVKKPVEKVVEKPKEKIIYSTEEMEERKKSGINKMKLAMRYNNPDFILRDIKAYQENGNQEKVDELIDYLITRYPDYELPESLGQ
ncbi:MAG: hypothetical protein L3J33_06220 [Rhodobacteraceae bacterium]|nr:hypothetical protein [Paracoccaceae bacterium]